MKKLLILLVAILLISQVSVVFAGDGVSVEKVHSYAVCTDDADCGEHAYCYADVDVNICVRNACTAVGITSTCDLACNDPTTFWGMMPDYNECMTACVDMSVGMNDCPASLFDDQPGIDNDVPEFGLIAGLGVALLAGLFIYKKRN